MGRVRLICLAAAAVILAAAPAALGHAAYKSSNPGDGSTVASPPGSVTAEFTEPLTDSSSLSVFDPCGRQVDAGDSRPSGYEMTVSMSAATAGTYTVEFKAQSALDSHVTSGSFEFTSSGGDACPGAEPPAPMGPGGGSGEGSGDNRSGGGGGGSVTQPGGATGSSDPGDVVALDTGEGAFKPAGEVGRGAGRGPRNRPRGSAETAPVAFQPARDSVSGEPAPWDLPVGGVVLAFALCVMIGAAGGRVYAGIVAPPRR